MTLIIARSQTCLILSLEARVNLGDSREIPAFKSRKMATTMQYHANNMTCVMDVDMLISLVEVRPCLWDMRTKEYNNRIIVNKEWEAVADELKVEMKTVKNKWKCLRDSYRVQLKKVSNPRSGVEAAQCQIRWPYFASLTFLNDVIQCRPTSGNLDTSEEDQPVHLDSVMAMTEEEMPGEDIGGAGKAVDSPSLPVYRPSSPATSSRKRSHKDSWKEKLVRLESQKLDYLKTGDSDDSCMHFFKSLVPFMKKLPEIRQLRVRQEFESILIREMEEMKTSSANEDHAYSK